MDWTILGIEPTQDKKAITAAYRARLKLTNPEDKPEEFKNLRAAYEEALKLADTPVTRDESPLGRWLERVAALYADFSARTRPENWRALLDDDVCTALDTRPAAEDGLLKFLMERYFLPQAVWQVLDEAFSFSRRVEELYESYPREFIDHAVMSGIRHPDGLPYDLFQPGRNGSDCDTYRRLYYQTNQTLPEEAAPLLEQLEALSEWHPYGQALRCRWWLFTGERQKAGEGFRTLAREYPGDAALNNAWASFCLEEGDLAEAEAVSRRVLDRNPRDMAAGRNLADCLAARGAYDEAKELCYGLMHACGGDPILMEQLAAKLRVWNEALIEQRKAALDRDPGDSGNAIELAWCYSQNERLEEAMEVARVIDPECGDQFSYHNLMGKLHHNREEFDAALDHMRTVEQILRAMKPDGTAETEKRLRRLPEMLQILGNCLMQTGDGERSRAIFAEALTLAPDDPKVLTMMGNIHYSSGEYEDCIDVLRHMIEVSPGSWFAHLMQSLCFYKLRRDREAFDAVNRAQSLHGGDLSLYLLKMQILLHNGVFEEVRSILDFLKEAGAPEDIGIDFIRAQLLELEDKDPDAAFRSYQSIARKVEDGDQLMDAALLYFRMASIMGKRSGHKTQDHRDDVIALLDKGLGHDAHDADGRDSKAWLLQRSDRLAEAIAMYQNINTPTAKRKLADLYFEDLRTYGKEALAIYEELLRDRQTPELCFYAATSARRLGELHKTEHYSRLAIELDPGDIDAHRNLAFLREKEGNYDEALHHIDLALAAMWENDLFYDWLLEHKLKILRRMGRHAEALAVIDDAMSRSDYDGYQMKFDICCQFGLFDQAEVVLSQWSRAQHGNPEVTKSTGKLHLYRRKMLKATFAYGKVKHQMDAEEERSLRIQLADLEANSKRLVQLWTERLDANPNRYNTLMHLSLELRRCGDIERSRKYAAEALPLVEEELKHYRSDELIHRTCHSLLLMLVGREEEARAELALARKRPLCEFCSYCACKDADIFEAFIEELAGNYARAKELYQKGQKNWPDELDFVSGENRLKKKKGT